MATVRSTRSSLLGLVIAAFALTFSYAGSSTRADKNGIVRIESGPISGTIKNGVRVYRGIPYAAPPIGALRWQPPHPPAPWKSIRLAVKFGNTCPQDYTLGVFGAPSDTEDCLYLNVYTSADERDRHRPVMLWIHGGGLIDGESNDYDGSKLVRNGKVVVVTINYRLGVLGILAHPALDKEGHVYANYGIMDQQFAMRWVRRNISAFGGDPQNVTIFGESSGAGSVIAHLVSPSAKGLFQHAIAESGGFAIKKYPGIGALVPLSAAERLGVRFASAAGCKDQSAPCLRDLSVARILAAQSHYEISAPVVDGTLFTQTFKSALSSGNFNHVPFINGSNRDEWRFFVAVGEAATGAPLTAAGYPAALKTQYGRALANQVLARYPLNDYADPSLALAASITDFQIACPTRKLNQIVAKQVPTYAYEFDDRVAPIYFHAASFPAGAYHTGELQYLFPLFRGANGTAHQLSPVQKALSDKIIYLWGQFARSRNGQRPWASFVWPQYDASLDNYLSFRPGRAIVAVNNFSKVHKCDFWDGVPTDY